MVGSVILIDDFVCWNLVWVLFILSRCVHDPNIQSFVLNFVMCCILTWGIMWSVDVSISTSIFLQFPLHKCISSRKCAHSIVCREICNVSNSYKVLFWALNNDFEFQKWSILKNKINFQKKKNSNTKYEKWHQKPPQLRPTCGALWTVQLNVYTFSWKARPFAPLNSERVMTMHDKVWCSNQSQPNVSIDLYEFVGFWKMRLKKCKGNRAIKRLHF